MRKKLLILISLFVSGISYAQQDAQFTQYMYNTITINPAYAGSRVAMSIFALHRSQWVGMDGAPVTNDVSIHTPIRNSNLGIGLSIMNDRIGPSDENNIAIDLSYTIPMSENYKLSFGIKGSANLLDVDWTKLKAYKAGDPRFQNNIDNKFSPNIGAGIYLHSDKSYFGLSVPKFLETKHFDGTATNDTPDYIIRERIHYYFIAGHVFDVNDEVQFKPSLLAKMVQGAPLQVDLSGNFMINQKFMAGVSYRWSAAVSAMVGFKVSDSWFIGYSYDFDTTSLADYNSGSHEIFLRYELFTKEDNVITPRFF